MNNNENKQLNLQLDWLILEKKKQLKIWFRFSKTMCSFVKYNNLGYSVQDIYNKMYLQKNGTESET